MPTVTVLGANTQTISLNYSASDTAFAAQALANTIASDVTAGTLTPVNYTGGTLPAESNAALFVTSTPGVAVQQPSGYTALIDQAPAQVAVFGAAGTFQRILAADGGLLYWFGAASSGTVLAGDGNNYVTDTAPYTGAAPTAPGVYNVILGNGSNVVSLERGQSTIATGTGINLVALGTSDSQVYAAGGETTIIGDVDPGAVPGSGTDTITAGGGFVSVYGGYSGIM